MELKFDKRIKNFPIIKNKILRYKRNLFLLPKLTILSTAIFLLIIMYIIFHFKFHNWICYFSKTWKDGKTLQEIGDNLTLNSRSSAKNIFFLETSCIDDGIIKLSARQACAVESAARANPDHNVYVLFASPVGYRNTSRDLIIEALQSYKNVYFNYVNIFKYAEKTPLEEWIMSKELFKSSYLEYHTNDVLKFITLWKYGGTYLDLDTIVLKSLNTLKSYNYAGVDADFEYSVATGIVHLQGISGHEIANLLINDLRINFNGHYRIVNGKYVLMRILQNICGTGDVEKMELENPCKNFRVYSQQFFYNLNIYDHRKFFMEEFVDEIFVSLKNSVVAHLWNYESAQIQLKKYENVPYISLAKKYCPKTYETCDEF